MLANRFDSVAKGDFNWLLGLGGADFESADLTSLLLKTTNTGSYINAPDIIVSPSEVFVEFHQIFAHMDRIQPKQSKVHHAKWRGTRMRDNPEQSDKRAEIRCARPVGTKVGAV